MLPLLGEINLQPLFSRVGKEPIVSASRKIESPGVRCLGAWGKGTSLRVIAQ
jgi:hypothetical protein